MLAPATPMIAPTSVTPTPSGRSYRWGIVVTAVAVLSVIGLTIVWQLRRADYFWRNPLASARTEWITDFEGEEADVAISPDGKVVVFLADRGGPFDVWLSQIGTSDFVNVTQGKFPAAESRCDSESRLLRRRVTSGFQKVRDPVLIHSGWRRCWAANLVVSWPTRWSRRGRLTEKPMAYHTAERWRSYLCRRQQRTQS